MKSMLIEISRVEALLEQFFIIDFRFSIDKISLKTDELLISEIVTETIKELIVKENFKKKDKIAINHTEISDEEICSFMNKNLLGARCDEVTFITEKICNRKGIEHKRIRINPGFLPSGNYNGFYHYFSLVNLGQDRKYIIDITYKQFFTFRRAILERTGILKNSGCYPGIFMLMNKSRQNTANVLLSNCWIKTSPQTLKNYFDGFMLYSRNGLYYDRMRKVEYVSEYTDEDYIRFLKQEDSVLNHGEKREEIGFQKEYMKNNLIKFDVSNLIE